MRNSETKARKEKKRKEKKRKEKKRNKDIYAPTLNTAPILLKLHSNPVMYVG
jgi:hypothetical protein